MQSRSWAGMARQAKPGKGQRKRRAAMAAGSAVLSAAAVAGAVAAAQPARAATAAPAAKTAAAGSHCYPESYVYETSTFTGRSYWTHSCGDVTWWSEDAPMYVGEGAGTPHRIWFKNDQGRTWCYWGHAAREVPGGSNGSFGFQSPGTEIQVSPNTRRC